MVGKKFSLILGVLVLSLFLIGVVSANHVYTYSDVEHINKEDNFTQGDFVYSQGFAAVQTYLRMEYHYSNNNASVLYSCTTSSKKWDMTCDWSNAPNGNWKVNLYLSSNKSCWKKVATKDFVVNPVILPPICGPLTNDYDCDNVTDKKDNCKFVWNPDQADCDNDGKGDVCDSNNECFPTSVCGNNIFELGEECDDGNLVNGDGCSANCQIELPICGDGICNGLENCSTCSTDCGICNNPTPKEKSTSTPLEFFECVPNWKCSGWSECDNGIMTRICEDKNFCDYEYNRPIESSLCTIQQSLVENEPNKYLGWFIGGVVLFIILLSVLINLKR
jgi:cysteine-rich repeat protein